MTGSEEDNSCGFKSRPQANDTQENMNLDKIKEILEQIINADLNDLAVKYHDLATEALVELNLAQKEPSPEPVAWMTKDGRISTLDVTSKTRGGTQWGPQYFGEHWCIPLYAHPPQKSEAPKVLTDEAVERISDKVADDTWPGRNGDNLPHGYERAWCDVSNAAKDALRYARDNGYLAPAAGLTVDDVMKIVGPLCFGDATIQSVTEKLTAAMEAKTRKS